MTDKKTNAKNDAQHQSRRPDMIAAVRASCFTLAHTSLYAYLVKPVGDDNSIWTAVGAAWLNKDKTSYTVQFDALPLGGRIQLQPRKEDNKN